MNPFAPQPSGGGKFVTGTDGADRLVGTAGRDVSAAARARRRRGEGRQRLHRLRRGQRPVDGGWGDDEIRGTGGNDSLMAIYMNEQREAVHFPRPIPFDVIPQIDVFMEDGSTKEEWKMVVKTKKNPRPRHRGHRHLRARPRLRRSRPGHDHRDGGAARPRRGSGRLARGRGRAGRRRPEARRVHHAQGLCRRVRRLRLPHPPRSHGARTGSTYGSLPTTCAKGRR